MVDKLASVGIHANDQFQDNDWFCVYDCESMLTPLGNSAETSLKYSANTEFTNVHEFLLCVLAYKRGDNPQIQTKEFWRRKNIHPYESIKKIVRFLNILSDDNFIYLRFHKYHNLFDRLNRIENENLNNKIVMMKVKAARDALYTYIRLMPVISFNGADYDMQLMR